MVKEPEAVIFDLDGVIIDNRKAHWKTRQLLSRIYSSFGFNIPADPPPDNDYLKMLTEAGLDTKQIRSYLQMWDEFDALVKPQIFPGANKLITCLKQSGKIIGILTNRHGASAKRSILQSGLQWDCLDFIACVAADKIGEAIPYEKLPNQYLSDFRKPDRRIANPIRRFLEALPEYPKSTLYIGDNNIDYKFAVNNAFSFVGVLSGDIKEIAAWETMGVERENIIHNVVGLDRGLNKYIY